MLFTVQHRYLSGWSDAGWGSVFKTRAAAQTEIDELIEDTAIAARRGDMTEAYSRSDYRVVRRAEGLTSS